MKQQITSKGLLSLTSDQIEAALAKGFLRFVNSTAKPHRKDSATIPKALLQKMELGANEQPVKEKKAGGKNWKSKKSISTKNSKGRTPIRSQTGHDHDRNHQKH